MENTTYYKYSRPEMLAYVPDTSKRILEIGCGEGRFAKLVKDKLNAEVWGVELSTDAANRAKVHLEHVINDDINKAVEQLPNNYFDCVICNDILEHLEDPYTLLKNINNNVLADDGVLISSIPNVRFIKNIYELIVDKDWRYRTEGILDFTHLRFFTKKSIVRMFEETGYKVIKCEGIQPVKSLKFKIFNLVTLNYFDDTKYLQFATVSLKKY